MTPSAIVQSDGMTGDSVSIDGALDAESITSADLSAGRWSGAAVEVLACDWADPEAGHICLWRGRIGDVARPAVGTNGAFQVEMLADIDPESALLPLRLSPTCRNALGDSACGISLDGLRIDCDVVGGASDRLQIEEALGETAGFAMGTLRFIRGPLSGVDRRIVAIEGATVLLGEDVPEAALVGARVRLTQGCDKRLSTCAARFGNALMFGGEPHVPGTDALLRYAIR
jgi:uncharacterized phage protein (TIGR02218 family)